jgi:hypothetical protein
LTIKHNHTAGRDSDRQTNQSVNRIHDGIPEFCACSPGFQHTPVFPRQSGPVITIYPKILCRNALPHPLAKTIEYSRREGFQYFQTISPVIHTNIHE